MSKSQFPEKQITFDLLLWEALSPWRRGSPTWEIEPRYMLAHRLGINDDTLLDWTTGQLPHVKRLAQVAPYLERELGVSIEKWFAAREASIAARRAQGGTKALGRMPFARACGTPAGYKSHIANDEEVDELCRKAFREHSRQKYWKDPEKSRREQRERRVKHPETHRNWVKKHYWKNRDKLLEEQRTRREQNKAERDALLGPRIKVCGQPIYGRSSKNLFCQKLIRESEAVCYRHRNIKGRVDRPGYGLPSDIPCFYCGKIGDPRMRRLRTEHPMCSACSQRWHWHAKKGCGFCQSLNAPCDAHRRAT